MTASLDARGTGLWSRGLGVVLAAVAGGVFAASTVLVNHADDPVLRGVASVVGSGSGWAAAGVAVGWFVLRSTPSVRRAVGLCTVFFLGATVAYYVVDFMMDAATSAPPPPGALVPEGSGGPGPQISVVELVLWSVASLLCGPVCAGVAWLARRRGIPGLLGRLCVPLGIAVWSAVLLSTSAGLRLEPSYLVAHSVAVVAGGVAAGVLLVGGVVAARRARQDP